MMISISQEAFVTNAQPAPVISMPALEKPKVTVAKKILMLILLNYKVAVVSNGDLVHGEGKLATEESPLLAHIKSKPAPNGVSPLAICQKPEVIHPIVIPCLFYPPSRNQTL